jgi:hypothetical protein
MSLSTAKAEATARDLKEDLEKRGFTVVESQLTDAVDGKDGRRLAIDSDMSIEITAEDAISKDIFGNALKSFTPHNVELAIDNAVATHTEVAKVMLSLSKFGFDIKIGEGANLGAAETAAGTAEAERNNVRWPKKGA